MCTNPDLQATFDPWLPQKCKKIIKRFPANKKRIFKTIFFFKKAITMEKVCSGYQDGWGPELWVGRSLV